MVHTCRQCQTEFEVTKEDLEFYDKISPVFNDKKYQVPPPTLCPDCRQQRRLAQINQVNLFERKCDGTGEDIISHFPPDVTCKVFSQKYWFSDQNNALQYGRDVDFSRPFFEQFRELLAQVPRPALFTDFLHDENSAYTNFAGRNKNCYLIFDSDENWDCYYSYGVNTSKSSSDCYRVMKLELCYEVVDSKHCYGSSFLTNCDNCIDSIFLRNCTACKNCIMCSNLSHKEYHIDNKPVSKEQFEQVKQQLQSYAKLQQAAKHFDTFRLKFPQRYMRGFQNENVTGDYLMNCKNATECYDCMHLQDGKYSTQVFIRGKDFMDTDESGEAELLYECNEFGYNGYHCLFSSCSLGQISELIYCIQCPHSSHLFGCVGLRGKKYCIFNKQYTQEEYEILVPKIIEHMMTSGEWGEYFPIQLSLLPYNLTKAQDYYPLTKEQVLEKGYTWRDPDQKEYKKQNYVIPDNIADVQEDITKELLACATCGRNYRIISQELHFHQQQGMPLPRQCFYCRHKARMSLRNPRKLWTRNCMKCAKEIQTSYAPDRPEIVYCEECYLREVY